MPRPLVFSNGKLLVQLDHRGNIRDLSFPVGIWNHLSGRAIRTGVWADGAFVWLDSNGWERDLGYRLTDGVLIGLEDHFNSELGVRLAISEWIPPGTDSFLREFSVQNTRDHARDVRIFFAQDLRMMEGDIGDCVFWHPELRGLVHFKGSIVALMRAEGADQYACGITDFGGAEGTWRDAEDGTLSMNAIAQGSVDSVQGIPLSLEAHASRTFCYEVKFSGSVDELNAEEWTSPPQGKRLEVTDIQLHLQVIATQVASSGAILAANDSDIMTTNRSNYSYCWIRDGAHVAQTMIEYGRPAIASAFVDWALPLLGLRPYFLQKYRADGTFGASWHPWTRPLPIQLDETASFLSLLCTMGMRDHPTADRIHQFLLGYVEDNLPRPSYDLWEEGWGIHIYTVATVIRALADTGEDVEKMTQALIDRYFADGHFWRTTDDARPDAASLFVGLLGILPIDDPRVQANADYIREHLTVRSGVGGIARYPGDYYFRQNEQHAGNPWVICSLWLAQHDALSGRLDQARDLLSWAEKTADPTGVLAEQLHPDTGTHLSVSPLTWSHAEYLRTRLLLD